MSTAQLRVSYPRRLYRALVARNGRAEARRILEDYLRRRDAPLELPPADWKPDVLSEQVAAMARVLLLADQLAQAVEAIKEPRNESPGEMWFKLGYALNEYREARANPFHEVGDI